MELEKIDKKMFEYLGHLYYGPADYKDLPWEEYITQPDSDWKFPIVQLEYWKKVFFGKYRYNCKQNSFGYRLLVWK